MHTVQATIVSYYKLPLYVTILISYRQESEQTLNYAAYCIYKERIKNYWILKIIFLKQLHAQFQVILKGIKLSL